MLGIFGIVCFSLLIFFLLTAFMKPIPKDNYGGGEVEINLVECAICHDDFDENIVFTKRMGPLNRNYYFCETCAEEFYQEYQEQRIERVTHS